MTKTSGPFLPTLFYATLAVLAIPCVALLFTETYLPLASRFCGIILPVTAYWLILSLSRNTGRTVWWMFFFIFLSAFQIVLLYLFGCGPISVDMFLNILTTNTGEVFELLGNLLTAITTVVVLYIPVLVAATMAVRKGMRAREDFVRRQRRMAVKAFVVACSATIICAVSVPTFSLKNDIFPINACYNLLMAVQRAYATGHYEETSADFRFEAKAEHDSDEREVYVLVVGETARASQFCVYGYSRNTTPRLAQMDGLTVFRDVMSQSNTTHKSVPMLLSSVSATDYDSIYHRKGIIAAFREAGFKTAFLSNQKRNHSFIDFFGEEADRTIFIRDSVPESNNVMDRELLGYVKKVLEDGDDKLLIVLHTYGSHFTYNERYAADDSYFRPDNDMSARRENRASLVNAYDNTIRETDRLLAELVDMLKHCGCSAAMLYTSDHGEDIFDDGNAFLHASPRPSFHQLNVPLLVWTSETYATNHPEIRKTLAANSRQQVSTSVSVFHTMLHLAGISTPYRNDSMSVASPEYSPAPQLYIDDHNCPRPLSEFF